jgi:hypothetical protein
MTQRHLALLALRKQTRDNLGLIVSVIAALFAGWAGYETHRTVNVQIQSMQKADAAARETIQLQGEAMQLDERPYVNAVPFDPQIDVSENVITKERAFTARLRVITNGRTPALGVRLVSRCLQHVKASPVASAAIDARNQDYTKNISQLTDMLKTLHLEPLAYLATTEEVQTYGCIAWLKETEAPDVVILGQLEYSDYFNTTHHTSFCYVGGFTADTFYRQAVRHLPVTAVMNEFEFRPCSFYKATFD